MITLADLAAVPLFEDVKPAELARLLETAADLRLGVGEYAVHEGDDRALFIVLEGKIEVTKRIDRVEKTIGFRAKGQFFGVSADQRAATATPRRASSVPVRDRAEFEGP